MLVRDWMTRRVITVSPKTSVLNARRLLQLHGFRHLPVTDGERVVGMISDRDIRVTDAGLARSLASLESDLLTGRYRRVENVMSSPVHSTTPDARVQTAAEIMVDRHIGALPVIGPDGLVGIIGLTDCVRAMLATAPHSGPTCERTADLYLDVDAPVPMGEGDDRPGRPAPRPAALVVDADPTSRLRTRNDLHALGYRVTTCPGPRGGVFCPAIRDTDVPCSRIPADAVLVVLDADNAALAAYYERWLPDAQMRRGTPIDLLTS